MVLFVFWSINLLKGGSSMTVCLDFVDIHFCWDFIHTLFLPCGPQNTALFFFFFWSFDIWLSFLSRKSPSGRGSLFINKFSVEYPLKKGRKVDRNRVQVHIWRKERMRTRFLDLHGPYSLWTKIRDVNKLCHGIKVWLHVRIWIVDCEKILLHLEASSLTCFSFNTRNIQSCWAANTSFILHWTSSGLCCTTDSGTQTPGDTTLYPSNSWDANAFSCTPRSYSRWHKSGYSFKI